ncbi:unnamed protein product [Enterobius vermicularis]|uniref:Uncharacterized protein n=1 Tax=Enterobius vermicularis TaxID=51028 RepID=A0A0N4VDL5_ENTVE|nr:unnamed protein product [Enterobius vermicularis]
MSHCPRSVLSRKGDVAVEKTENMGVGDLERNEEEEEKPSVGNVKRKGYFRPRRKYCSVRKAQKGVWEEILH